MTEAVVTSDQAAQINLQTAWEMLLANKLSAEQFVRFIEATEPLVTPGSLYLKGIGLAIAEDFVLLARDLANLGAARYPDNTELQKAARVLAPPKVLSVGGQLDHGLGLSVQWLGKHSGEYVGMWVAIRGGEFLGAAPTRQALVERLGLPLTTSEVLITRIPER